MDNTEDSTEKEEEVTIADLPENVQGLAAMLLLASSQGTAGTYQSLYENEKKRRELHADTIDCVRWLVSKALSGRYAPTDDYLISCLYPTVEQIAEYTEIFPR